MIKYRFGLFAFFILVFLWVWGCDRTSLSGPVKINFNKDWKYYIAADSTEHPETFWKIDFPDASWIMLLSCSMQNGMNRENSRLLAISAVWR
jgi:hypothetical protein